MENRRASTPPRDHLTKEIEELKEKEKDLAQAISEKDKTISVYVDLIDKLRKKLLEKY